MRFYLVLFFCVSVIFTSCKDKKGIPDDVIPEHAMAEVLTDIHIVDGSLFELPQQTDSLAKHSLALYMGVFKANHIDTALFRKSLKYYTTRPELINEIYSGITNRLQKKIDSLGKIKPKINIDSVKEANSKHKADSVRTAKADSFKTIKQRAKMDSLQRSRSVIKPAKPKKLKKVKLNTV